MQKYKINENEQGQRLDKFILKKYKNINKVLLYKLIRKNCIKVNRKKTKFDYVLKTNDEIFLFLHDNLLTTKKGNLSFLKCDFLPKICYEDKNIILVEKQRQVKMHDGVNCLLNACLKYLYETKSYDPNSDSYFTPAFSNRLDTNTKGLLILCKTPVTIKEMNNIIKNNNVKKTYTAICNGKLNVKNKIYKGHIVKTAENLFKVTNIESKNSKNIITSVNTVKACNNFSLLEIGLITGRTHQIRAHLQFLGYPILGDNKYGNIDTNKYLHIFTQCLCSTKLEFNFKNNNNYDILGYLNGKSFSIHDDYIENIFNRITE